MKKYRIALGCMILGFSAWAEAARISNRVLSVQFENNALSFYKAGESASFFRQGVLGKIDAGLKVSVVPEKAGLWGEGQSLVLVDRAGATYTVSLYQDLPFAVLACTITNRGADERVVKKVPFLTGEINLGLPPERLTSISTAGWQPVSASPEGYTFMTVADAETRNGVVCGWLTHERGYGIVTAEAKGNRSELRTHIDYGDLRIPAGKEAEAELLVIGFFTDVRDGLERYADTIAEQLDIQLPAQPTVYCTWYHGGASDAEKIAANTDFVAEVMKPYQFHVMQIDDFWQDGVRENGPNRNFSRVDPNGPYPGGMTGTADYIREKGLVPGIWYIPFAGTWNDPFWADKQHLFLKQGASPDNYLRMTAEKQKMDVPEGPEKEWPYVARWGGTCLDVTHPEAQEYIRETADILANKWGYTYFKMDGLWTGTGTRIQYINAAYIDDDLGLPTRHNPAISPIEAYAKGLDIIREAVGKEVFLLGCCQAQNVRSFGPSIGRVDAMRVGPDNGANPDALVRGPRYSSRVYFLNKRVWYNDPDPVYVRKSFPIEMSKTAVSWTGISGSLHSSSYQYGELPQERLDILLHSIPSHDLLSARPVDFLDSETPQIWHLADTDAATRRDVVALFNWDIDAAQEVSSALDRMALPEAERYVGFDFWANRFLPPFSKEIGASLEPGACSVRSIRPELDRPQIVSTSRHLLQGVVDLKAEQWTPETQILSGISSVVAKDTYELRAVVPSGTSWKLVDVVLKNAPDGTTTSFSQLGTTIRVRIDSSSSADIEWELAFVPSRIETLAVEKVSNFSGRFSLSEVVLQWDRPQEGYGWRLLRNGEVLSRPQGESFTDQTVELGQVYSYELQSAGWDGTWSKVTSVEVVTPKTFTVPPMPPRPTVYCSDLKAERKTRPREDGFKLNKSFAAEPLNVNGKIYQNGLGVQAKSTLHYVIPEHSKRFVSTVGLDSNSKGAVRFVVFGDVLEMGEPAVEIGGSPILEGDFRIWNFDLELDPRFKDVYLVVENAGESDIHGLADWVNAGFIQ